jgi:hypothetical protein
MPLPLRLILAFAAASTIAAAPAVEIDAASFANGPVPKNARANALAARPLAAEAFSAALPKAPPAKARQIKRLTLAWGAGATEPVAWIDGQALVIQYYWDNAPARAEVVFAIGCAFTPGKGACADQGD